MGNITNFQRRSQHDPRLHFRIVRRRIANAFEANPLLRALASGFLVAIPIYLLLWLVLALG
jgi:hypothetical protein